MLEILFDKELAVNYLVETCMKIGKFWFAIMVYVGCLEYWGLSGLQGSAGV